MLLITGGAGFIGSNFVLRWLGETDEPVVDLDKLTYAGNPGNLSAIANDPRHLFVHGDIADRALVSELLRLHQPRAVVNFAAETHVDRSIDGPGEFIQTNVVGTFHLLEEVRRYWQSLQTPARERFRFLHVSTDEVYGSLGMNDPAFSETTAYAPNSPYSATKAASDHLIRAYHHTYGLPTLTSNCSNNYGPRQFPEKLIPLMIHHALRGKNLPVYGDGANVRDWVFVADHCAAVATVLERGRPGETYNIGGNAERTNLQVVHALCDLLTELRPGPDYRALISFVGDRPGHDLRYAIDGRKIAAELGWHPAESFSSGLRKTLEWYLANQPWVNSVTSGDYQHWVQRNYGTRSAA
ncbi:MAG: dTDP-glucose 4,6-dehydratase [Betaproteobacteria bacterium]